VGNVYLPLARLPSAGDSKGVPLAQVADRYAQIVGGK